MAINLMKNNRRSGFTLIEVLLYLAILSVVALLLSAFLPTVIEARVKHKAIEEVESQGMQAMSVMLQSVRNASSIAAPAVGASGTTLNLVMASSTINPTIFDLTAAGTLRLKEGSALAMPLTNQRVTTTALTFTNASATSTSGLVTIRLTLAYATSSARQMYVYQKTFYGSASLKL